MGCSSFAATVHNIGELIGCIDESWRLQAPGPLLADLLQLEPQGPFEPHCTAFLSKVPLAAALLSEVFGDADSPPLVKVQYVSDARTPVIGTFLVQAQCSQVPITAF